MSDFAARRVMMVDNQIRPSDVTKYPVIAAMLAVPREAYVPSDRREAAYMGENLPLGPRRVVLDPRTLAKMLDALNVQADELVLDVGAGLGYSAAVIARMAEAVVALEEEPLAAEMQAALGEQRVDNVAVVAGALTDGAARHAPYDVICVEGGVEEVPEALVTQLKPGGRIGCLFMQGELGVVRIGTKSGDGIVWRDAFNAAAPVLPGFGRKRQFAL
ncbi:protein-L-isoaspartate(D-aspartate) O-methyltransferase [Gemmobacter megaterium]|uniref:Protein-L-isoaspartate O-methyltransferase n=1 Tax=Gemmobacter megaterium TaxID=1086013 RepID=A0A1N7M0F3_9RHOB|nr:protein-L-isoaspartate O-methyltransferase [Gemmobacter megaterium]GGE09540.1 protein-L-isoaspartate O-methyltransferase [Gemmobacter megaterium]SIS79499.1 protein-L-isoaspartate(D-aspartate) O-methyltransferase [Gemmobacter megaterium]